ncbi:glycosyltransferase family 87 protein [Kineococcus xinjiangensis]|uniref:glycosyltransferase family 87 protein n=1 Tax=Kineococcus xinjiangensis TaxID=512762 RepID=UPI001304FE88|nr:glycosyltransferase family 87 protein [Kineococcus xinjiangensis]
MLRRLAAGRAGLVVPVALAVLWCAVVVTTHLTAQWWQPGYDLAVYRRGARDLLAGRDLYLAATDRGHYFVYPPLAAVLMVPLLLLPPSAALLIWDAVLVVAVVLGTGWLLRAVPVRAGAGPRAPLVTGLSLAAVLVSDPFRESVVLGQISPLVVLGLVVGCLLGGRRGAVLAALAASVKVTPALVLTAAVNRTARRAFAVRVGVAGIALTLLGAVAAPASWRHYFTDLLWNSARVAAPDTPTNNSLAGALAHVGVPGPTALVAGAALSVPLLVVLLLAARRTDWSGPADRMRFGLLVSLVAVLVTPVAWTHHALAAPLAAVVLLAARPRGLRLAVVVVVGLLPWLPPVLEVAADLRGGWRVLSAPLALTRPLSLLVLVALLLPGRRVLDLDAAAPAAGGRADVPVRPRGVLPERPSAAPGSAGAGQA